MQLLARTMRGVTRRSASHKEIHLSDPSIFLTLLWLLSQRRSFLLSVVDRYCNSSATVFVMISASNKQVTMNFPCFSRNLFSKDAVKDFFLLVLRG